VSRNGLLDDGVELEYAAQRKEKVFHLHLSARVWIDRYSNAARV
jgi:hypothetical protein